MKTLKFLISVFVLLFALNMHAQSRTFEELEQATYPATLNPLYLTGLFDGRNFDTIGLFPVEIQEEYFPSEDITEYYSEKWLLMSKHGTVPQKEIESYWPELIDEGDLDANGTTEFGILFTGLNGCWTGYQVFDVHKGKLREFTRMLNEYSCDTITTDRFVWREDGKIKYLERDWNYRDEFDFPKWVIRVLKR